MVDAFAQLAADDAGTPVPVPPIEPPVGEPPVDDTPLRAGAIDDADDVGAYLEYYPDDRHQVEQRVGSYLQSLADHGFLEIVAG